MKRDQGTYSKISRQFDDYTEIVASRPLPPPRGLPPQRPYVPVLEQNDMGKNLFAFIGLGIAGVLFILAVLSFLTAMKWSDLDRDGAAVGYTLVGVFLSIASIGGGLATWNHNYRVLSRPTASHH